MALDATPAGQVQEFLRVLSRRRWQILLPALVVLTLGTCFAVVVPKKFVVETRVEIRESRNPLDPEFKNRQQTATAREMAVVRDHIINYARVSSIVGSDLIALWPEYERSDRDARAEMIKGILRNVEVHQPEKARSEGSTFLDLVYKDVDPERAQVFLERLTRVWIEDVIGRQERELEAERDVLGETVTAAREHYRRASDNWTQHCREMGWNPAEAPDSRQGFGQGSGDFVFEQLSEFKRQRIEVEENLRRVMKERDLLERRWRQVPAVVREVEIREGQRNQGDEARLLLEIAALDRQLESITKHNHRYPRIMAERAEKEAALAELGRLQTGDSEVERQVPNPAKTRMRDELDGKDRQIATLRDTLERTDGHIQEFEAKVARRVEDFGLQNTLWDDLEVARTEKTDAERLLRDKEASIQTTKRANDDVYAVVSPPLGRDATTEPSAVLIVAFSLLAGLALGLSVAVVAEYARDCYRTASDLADVMAVPVLGSIGTIVTRIEARRRFVRRATVGLSTLVIVAGLGWMTWMWHATPERLPLTMLEAIESFRLMLM